MGFLNPRIPKSELSNDQSVETPFLHIDSVKGRGTIVRASWPLQQSQDPA